MHPDSDDFLKWLDTYAIYLAQKQIEEYMGLIRSKGIEIEAVINSDRSITLKTNLPAIPWYEVPAIRYSEELYHHYRQYQRLIYEKYGYQIDVRRPNLYSAFHNSRPIAASPSLQWSDIMKTTLYEVMSEIVEPPDPEFETNMVEALVGWKGWDLNDCGQLRSHSYQGEWLPDRPFEARCSSGCKLIPREKHSCGIYGATEKTTAHHYGTVRGEVYGWGRYVRGTDGWRTQFAYPKAFHLEFGQEGLIEPLKAYHVPIYVSQPLRIYNPEEDGYTTGGNDEDRRDEEDGSSGAADDSGSQEA